MAVNEPDAAATRDSGRDPALDRVYAAGAREEPPRRLDDTIRAAARREVGARPRSIGAALRYWSVPVSIAAVLVLSVSVVILMREEGVDRLQEAPPAMAPPPESAPQALPEQTAPSAPPKREEPHNEGTARLRDTSKLAAAAEKADRNRKEQVGSNAMAGAPRPAAPPRPAPQPFAEYQIAPGLRAPAPTEPRAQSGTLAKEAEPGAGVGSGALERAPTKPTAAADAPAPAATGPAAQAKSSIASPKPRAAAREAEHQRDDAGALAARPVWTGFEQQPPEKWLARIEELRRNGRETEADEMLVEFRKRFPGHPVPPAAADR